MLGFQTLEDYVVIGTPLVLFLVLMGIFVVSSQIEKATQGKNRLLPAFVPMLAAIPAFLFAVHIVNNTHSNAYEQKSKVERMAYEGNQAITIGKVLENEVLLSAPASVLSLPNPVLT